MVSAAAVEVDKGCCWSVGGISGVNAAVDEFTAAAMEVDEAVVAEAKMGRVELLRRWMYLLLLQWM